MNTPQKPTAWYVAFIERTTRAAIDERKRKMLEVIEREKVVRSFNHLQSMVGGRKPYSTLAWKQLRAEGAVVPCKLGGWTLPGSKLAVEKAADGFLTSRLRGAWGDVIREQFFEENNPQLKAAREALEATERAKLDPLRARLAEIRQRMQGR